ncbi:MAG: hypothetical protein ACLGPL_08775 [Acidobacteriota bacterium]
MAGRKGKCTNFGNGCSNADGKVEINIPAGEDFQCPECGKPLTVVTGGGGSGPPLKLILMSGGALVLCAAIGIFAYLNFSFESPEEKFLAQAKKILAPGSSSYSPAVESQLQTLAAELKLANGGDLIKKIKLDYLMALKKSFSPSETETFCGLVREMGMASTFSECDVPPVDFNVLLAQGEFVKARDLLKKAPESEQTRTLLRELETPCSVQASFQYQKKDQGASPMFVMGKDDLKGVELTSRDAYRLKVTTAQSMAHLYIFQKDHYGDVKRIFPDPVWSKGYDNPLAKGQTCELPGQKDWYYLDELPSDQQATITETIYVVASPWKAVDLEQLYGKIYEATSKTDRSALIDQFLRQLQLRNDSSLKCAYYVELPFQHAK